MPVWLFAYLHAFSAVREPSIDTSRGFTYEATSSLEEKYDHEDGYLFIISNSLLFVERLFYEPHYEKNAYLICKNKGSAQLCLFCK